MLRCADTVDKSVGSAGLTLPGGSLLRTKKSTVEMARFSNSSRCSGAFFSKELRTKRKDTKCSDQSQKPRVILYYVVFKLIAYEVLRFTNLGGRFEYFLFFLVGEGEGGVRGLGKGGGSIFIGSPRRGGGVFSRRGRGRGARRASAANWGAADIDSQEPQMRPELHDWLRFEL